MSEFQKLQAADGNQFSVYVVQPEPKRQNGAAVIVLQEIFGVNTHIREVAEIYAREGYLVFAPALFDRVQWEVNLDYSPEGREIGRGLASRLTEDQVLLDIAATIAEAQSRVIRHKVGVVGYCLGGSYAWLSATRLKPDAAVGYYGSKVIHLSEEKPQAPILLHFGIQDQGIPLEGVERFRQAQPSVPVHLYEAGHGFNRHGTASYSAPAAELAFARTLQFFQENLLVN